MIVVTYSFSLGGLSGSDFVMTLEIIAGGVTPPPSPLPAPVVAGTVMVGAICAGHAALPTSMGNDGRPASGGSGTGCMADVVPVI